MGDHLIPADMYMGERKMKNIWLDSYPAGTPNEIDADAYSSLVALFEQSCQRYAEWPAYHNLGVTLTFRDLERLSGQFAAYLGDLGLARGDRVALMMPNLLQYPVVLFGVLRAGLVAVNTNPLYTARELRHQLKDSGARCIVIVENFAHVLADVIADTPLEHVVTTGIGYSPGGGPSTLSCAASGIWYRRIHYPVP